MRIFILLCLVLAAVFAAQGVYGQERPVLDTSPPPAADPRTPLKQFGKASASYVPSKDETVANSGPIDLFFKDSSGRGWMSASFVSKGKLVAEPSAIALSVFTAAPDRKFVDDLTFRIEADKVVVFSGKSDLADGRTNGREIYSSLKVTLPRKDFEKLAKAKVIMLHVGPSVFEVNMSDKSNFQDLLKLVE